MEKRDVLTKVLAVLGTVLVWIPILAMVLLSVGLLIAERTFRFDYMIPGELFPAVLAGAGLLLWAAVRARSYRRLIGWSFGFAVVALVGSQALAVLTGLASGRIQAEGWPWVLVTALLAAYDLAVVALGVDGVLLLRDLFKGRGKT
jgi:hypothetical protein